MEEQAVAAWLDGYSQAWGTYDPEQIGALFSADAVYWYDPFTEPLRGREAIVADWLKDRDEATARIAHLRAGAEADGAGRSRSQPASTATIAARTGRCSFFSSTRRSSPVRSDSPWKQRST